MSNSVKIKFAGLLRNLARRLGEEEAVATEKPRPVAGAAPFAKGAAAAVARLQSLPPATAAPMSGSPQANPDELLLPLQSVLANLSMDLRAKIMQAPPAGTMIAIPVEKILTQLAFGSVKIAFGELRRAAPGVFVNSGGEHDHKAVMLPLNEILARLNPGLLARRPTQKQVEVTDDIAGPFGAGAEGVKISVAAKPMPSSAAPSLRMNAPPTFSFPTRGITPAATPPAANVMPVAPPPPRQFTPPAPADMAAPSPRQFAPAPLHGTTVFAPRSNGAPKPPPAASPVPPPPPKPAPAPQPAPRVPAGGADICVSLAELSENWPEGLRLEIRQSNLVHAQVLLPVSLIEPALKRGRVTFIWKNLRPLIQPPPQGTSIHDSTELELPLNVIAPLFFAHQKMAPRSRTAERPPAEIPNLFFGFPQPETAQPKPVPPPEPVTMAPPPAPMPEFQPQPPVTEPAPPPIQPRVRPIEARPQEVKPVDAKLSDTNYYVWSDTDDAPQVDETEYKRPPRPATDFSSRRATPNEIVARAMELPGVVGAIVALPDGLKVASQIPAELNADTLAAFLPQIFDRVSQSTRELRMGALNNFNFTVGNVPWKIYRVNAVYFAAFGQAGEALPTVQLAALAAELDRKKQ